MEFKPLNQFLSTEGPLVIAGPCSLESQEQIIDVALQLRNLPSEHQVHLLRAGIWKPRTRPNQFEGLGIEALPYLLEAKKISGLKTTVEVATPEHIEAALKYEVDVLWIGARTSANPFSVQEIADALKGVDIPVMVKNPINADLQLWMGAIERLALAGLDKIIAIHRGFSMYSKSQYRNAPIWKIPVELKSKWPTLPLICDPSHITGDRSLILEVAQKAMDLNFDGLIIETHPQPEIAKSDAAQQVTPQMLHKILRDIKIKKGFNTSFDNDLMILREQIDHIDRQILNSLKERKSIVEQIAHAKKAHNLTALQLHRFKDLMQERMELAQNFDLNVELVKEIFDNIHEDSLKIQSDIFKFESK